MSIQHEPTGAPPHGTPVVVPDHEPASTGWLVVRTVLAAALVAVWVRAVLNLIPLVRADGFPLDRSGVVGFASAGAVSLALVLVLVIGPQPRYATKWAWFWLGAIPPLWLAFLLLEPVPLWVREPAPARSRLTGGKAFLIALVGGAILQATVPGYRVLFG